MKVLRSATILSSTSRLQAIGDVNHQEQLGQQQRFDSGDAEVLQPLANADSHRKVSRGSLDGDGKRPVGVNNLSQKATLLACTTAP